MITKKIMKILVLGIVLTGFLYISEAQQKRKQYYRKITLPKAQTITKTDGKSRGVILIIIDALRPDHLGHFGYHRNTSPAMDKLAGEGITFSHMFANAPWTRPSTACIFTSKNASRHGVETEETKLHESFLTLAEVLQNEGIKTGAVIGNGNVNSLWGFNQGFDDYMDTRDKWKGLPTARQVFDLGKEWLKNNKDEKFFLTLFMVDPHSPYKSPPYYEKLYTRIDRRKILRSPKWQYKKGLKNEIVYNMVGLYDGAIRYCDDILRLLVRDLKAFGIYDETTIIVTADHGEGFGEHSRFRHSYHFYEEFIRTPLIIKSPVIKEKGKCSIQMVETLDLFPTIVDIFGFTVPESCEGISIFTNESGKPENDRMIFSEYNNFGLHNQCIRGKKWKLIYEAKADKKKFYKNIKNRSYLPFFRLDKPKYELYSMEHDPFERKNLFYKYPKKGQELLKQLKEFLAHEKFTAEQIKRSEVDPKILKTLKSIGYFK
ncbi:MAG: sulfatase [Chitinispirillia bacterium]|jgi:arylsulfatase A-like enzyme